PGDHSRLMPPDGTRHRFLRHHLNGIEEVRARFADAAPPPQPVRTIVLDLKAEGSREGERPFPRDPEHFRKRWDSSSGGSGSASVTLQPPWFSANVPPRGRAHATLEAPRPAPAVSSPGHRHGRTRVRLAEITTSPDASHSRHR